MSRFFKYVRACVVVFGFIATLCLQFTTVSAADKVWADHPIVKLSEVPQDWPTTIMSSCSGTVGLISISGWHGLQEACIYGKVGGVQVAKYAGSTGYSLYAIAFALDTSFTQLRNPCTAGSNCVYGQSEDTMMVQIQKSDGLELALIENFSSQLVKHIDGAAYYAFEGNQNWEYVSFGARTAKVGAMAASLNGKWGIVEVKSYGYVRINLETLEYKRVVAPSGGYGYGSDPSYDLTISDDGTKLAVTGWNASIAVYEIDDECGDRLTEASSVYFSPYVYACKNAHIDINGLFPGFRTAQFPRFSESGMKLSLYVYANGQSKFASIGPDLPQNKNKDPLYIAFGDSFSSGEGEISDTFYLPTTNIPPNRCHVSTRSYPYLIGGGWSIKTINKACSGGRINDVKLAAHKASEEVTQTSSPSLVSIGVGGNDIELMGKLKTCLHIGECEWVSAEKRQSGAAEIKAIFPEIVELVSALKLEYPDSYFALVGYPSVVNTTEGMRCSVLVSTLLSSEERKYMDESIKYLNKILQAAAHYTNVAYIDIENALAGERLCDASEQAMNSIRIGDDIAPLAFLSKLKLIGAESFHPTPRGHQLIANAIQGANSSWKVEACNNCEFSLNQLDPPQYWMEGQGQSAVINQQKAKEFLSTSESNSGSKVSFNFFKGTFLPRSKVMIEIHSEIKKLGEYVAADDGSLMGEVVIPEEMSGYHTVHALGVSQSGVASDLYQTLSIENLEDQQFADVKNQIVPKVTQDTTKKSSSTKAVLGDTVVSFTTPNKFGQDSTGSQVDTKKRQVQSATNEVLILTITSLVVIIGAVGLIAWWLRLRRNRRLTG